MDTALAGSAGPPESRRDWIVQLLREAIAKGELRPGDRLVEREISTRTGVSRGPVREAILLLHQEGLVTSYSYRGAQVAEVSAEEADEVLLPLREVLERFAFRHAAGRLTETDFAALAKLVDDMHAAAERDDRQAVVDADIRFHDYVVSRSGWPSYEHRWRSLVARIRSYFWTDAPRHGSLHDIAVQHQALLDVLRSGDGEQIAAAVGAHIHDRPAG